MEDVELTQREALKVFIDNFYPKNIELFKNSLT
jgi:hypothetical protein